MKCLKSRYDRPRLIHQAHVRRILNAPVLKEGSGKELRILHDIVLQHLRALGHEPTNSFITSLLELKLDTTTMFEWQRHSQEHADVPDWQELLDFLNLRAQAAEASSTRKKFPGSGNSSDNSNNSQGNKPGHTFSSNAALRLKRAVLHVRMKIIHCILVPRFGPYLTLIRLRC